MISINTNLASLIIQQNLKNSSLGLNQAIERMTTGSKLNHAKNNAANFSINTGLKTKLGGYLVAQDNASMGLDMLTTAMDSLNLLNDHFTRLRNLAEQAANGTYGEDSLNAIQSEAEARIAEIVRVINNTEYNKINLFGVEEKSETPEMSHNTDISEAVKISECGGVLEAGKKYTLDSQAELETLQNYVNSGGDTTGSTFIMTGDITMTGDSFRGIGTDDSHAFKGTFDGNGYKIENLVIDKNEHVVGLFGCIQNATIENLALVNCNIHGYYSVGGLVAISNCSLIQNCYVTGTVNCDVVPVGGVVGASSDGSIVKNCYASCNVAGSTFTGGLVGHNTNSIVENCYATGNERGSTCVSGLVASNGGVIKNCYATSNVSSNIPGLSGYNNGEITDCVYSSNSFSIAQSISYAGSTLVNVSGITTEDMQNPEIMSNYGFTEENGWYFDGGLPKLIALNSDYGKTIAGSKNNIFQFQVGINGNKDSQIELNFGFMIKLKLDFSDREAALESMITIDEYLTKINERQTELGAGVNRLESALDSIAVSIQNLTSTKSTINDADIAKESSAYIKSQILQQAASTLLATANQTPSIALGLLQNATIRH